MTQKQNSLLILHFTLDAQKSLISLQRQPVPIDNRRQWCHHDFHWFDGEDFRGRNNERLDNVVREFGVDAMYRLVNGLSESRSILFLGALKLLTLAPILRTLAALNTGPT